MPKEHQGSVFGARRLLAQGPYPIAVWIAGSLSENIALKEFLGTEQAVVALIILCGVILEIFAILGLIFSGSLLKLEAIKDGKAEVI